MAVTCYKLNWLHQLLSNLHVPQASSIPLYCDRQAALPITANLIYHERTKHIKVDCHFVRDEY